MKRRYGRAAAALALVALTGAACGGGEDDAGAAGGGSSATLTASEFKWDPTSLSVAAGGTIEVTNEDDAKHNVTVEEAGIDEDVDPNGSVSVDVGDAEPGSYDFVCEYHPDTMKGTLEVTE
ncbi:MAG TPA: cupredoxin domain-containing protein [Actinomycetota bacterium]|nr:cupredoxin domain-containing protein [Actinomycetota bacterium]